MNARSGTALIAALALAVFAACKSDGEAEPDPSTLPGDPTIGPARLSETGLYSDFASRTVTPSLIRFAPAHGLWADGVEKTRYLFLPPGTKVDTHDMDRWVFPVGTKVWKEFRVDGKLVETRLLWKRQVDPGINSWWRVAYVWEADGSDALARVDGVPAVQGTKHDVPKQADCTFCHLYVSDGIIGFSALELSSMIDTVGVADTGQLLPLAKRDVYTHPPSADFNVPGSGNVRDVLAYMHANCGFCHNERLTQLAKRELRLRLQTNETAIEQTGAYTTTIHAKMHHVIEETTEAIVPGEPDKSQMYVRLSFPDELLRMPPRATKVVDPRGQQLMRDWILGLPK